MIVYTTYKDVHCTKWEEGDRQHCCTISWFVVTAGTEHFLPLRLLLPWNKSGSEVSFDPAPGFDVLPISGPSTNVDQSSRDVRQGKAPVTKKSE